MCACVHASVCLHAFMGVQWHVCVWKGLLPVDMRIKSIQVLLSITQAKVDGVYMALPTNEFWMSRKFYKSKESSHTYSVSFVNSHCFQMFQFPIYLFSLFKMLALA